MRNRTSLWYLLIAGVLASSHAALAADAPQSTPTPEARQQMAAIHEQMAACLKSSRPIAECRAEMFKSCQQTMGQTGCPMGGPGGRMGRGMMGSGWAMGPGMMQGGVAPQPAPK